MDDPLEWNLISSRTGPSLKVFEVRFDSYEHPISLDTFERVVLQAPSWVNCVVIDSAGMYVFVRQFRFGVGQNTLEIPGGTVDPGETPLEAAKRELFEETGFVSSSWMSLGSVQANPATQDNICHHWLATDAESAGAPSPGPGEHISVERLTREQVIGSVNASEIMNVLGLSALSRVINLWSDGTESFPEFELG